MEEPKTGEKYLHFKGGEYEIIAVCRDCDNGAERVVAYKQLYRSETPKGTIWVRSLEDFLGEKEFDKDIEINGKVYKAGQRVKRFSLISNNS